MSERRRARARGNAPEQAAEPPAWLFQFREADWKHLDLPRMPQDFGFGERFWRHARARERWQEKREAWLRANGRIMRAVWPRTHQEFEKQAAAEPWRVLRHDRDAPWAHARHEQRREGRRA